MVWWKIDENDDDEEEWLYEIELLNIDHAVEESIYEEVFLARDRVKGACSKLLQTSVQAQKDAALGCLRSQTEDAHDVIEVEDESALSKYENSDKEIDTPPSNDVEDLGAIRRKKRVVTVRPNIDFRTFK